MDEEGSANLFGIDVDKHDFSEPVSIRFQNRSALLLRFDQKPEFLEPLYSGVVVIDDQTKSLVYIERELSTKGKQYIEIQDVMFFTQALKQDYLKLQFQYIDSLWLPAFFS